MYNDSRGFSLIRFIVKVLIVIIFVILAIWLISKVINKTSNNAYEKNMSVMKEASVEYFKRGNLPKEEGEEKKITLGDLIKMKYIESFDKKCDRNKSYSQATMVDDYYALRVELLCGNKKNYIYTSIDKDGNCVGDSCPKKEVTTDKKEDKKTDKKDTSKSKDNKSSKKDTSKKTDNNKNVNKDNNSKNNNKSSSSSDKSSKSNDSKKTLYYEHVKVNRVYSDWTYNKLSGNNVETKNVTSTVNKYCRMLASDYYVVAYIPSSTPKGSTTKIVIRFDNIPSNTKNYNLVVAELFDNDMSKYNKVLSSPVKTTFVVGNNGYGYVNIAHALSVASLKNSNANITKNVMYSDKGIFVETDVKINNYNNLYSYVGKVEMYFLPIHYIVKYADESSCVKDTSLNTNKYSGYEKVGSDTKSVTMYRSYTDKKDESNKKWSTSKNIDGYVLTGKSEYR